jgi:hypothetical protein
VIWALNVYSLSTKETCDQIAYIADLPGQQAPGVLLELGAKPSFSLSCLLRASRACLVKLLAHRNRVYYALPIIPSN